MNVVSRLVALDLAAIFDERVDDSWKGMPPGIAALRLGDLGAQGWNVERGDLPLPLLVLRRSAVAHNLAVMARFCAETGALMAPHGKTTMAPQLFERQLDAGSWGITAATVQQLAVYRRHGVGRVLLANQVVGDVELAWLGRELRRDPAFELWSLVDSPEAVERIAIAGRAAGRPARVLLEVGVPNGRTGVRNDAEVDAVLRAIDEHAGAVLLDGVETFEGFLPGPRDEGDHEPMAALLQRVADLVTSLRVRGALPDDHLVSAGGSKAFDLVVDVLRGVTPAPARLVLRSGCAVTHDHGTYARSSPLVDGASAWATAVGALRPGLELWSYVLSQPEPGLALLGFGKRDAAEDAGRPRPFRHVPGPHATGGPLAVDEWRVAALNDQHAYLRTPEGAEPHVADRVVLGISHPCTAIDKWRLIFEVDDAGTVVGGIRTFF